MGRKIDELRACGERTALVFLDHLVDRLGSGTQHPKVDATVDWVTPQVEEGHHIVVFTSWLLTRDAIGKALFEAGVDGVAAPAGSSIPDDIARLFKTDPDGRFVVLVLSDRFSESIDVDGGNPSIVHHDLTWNPVRLTQRCGRVVRIRTGFQPGSSRAYLPPDPRRRGRRSLGPGGDRAP